MDKVPLGYYRHFKKGDIYRVLLIAKHEKTREDFVIYQSTIGDLEIWVRSMGHFLEEVDVHGKKVPRFQYIPE